MLGLSQKSEFLPQRRPFDSPSTHSPRSFAQDRTARRLLLDAISMKCELSLMCLQDQLLPLGYDVHVVTNGEDAISKLKEIGFDVAILDISMPKVDGWGVLKFIKQEKPTMKVILFTAYADLRYSIMSRESGADAILTKPYVFEMLRLSIESLVNK